MRVIATRTHNGCLVRIFKTGPRRFSWEVFNLFTTRFPDGSACQVTNGLLAHGESQHRWFAWCAARNAADRVRFKAFDREHGFDPRQGLR